MSLSRSREVRESAADESLGQPMPCTFCGRITAHETLRALGARCVGCFRAYCETVPQAPQVGDKRGGPKGWAWALRSREMAGERLTPPQKSAWRDALRAELAAAEN